MDKKLNNLIEFKEFNLDKLENKPGKVLESLNHIETYDKFDEKFFHDTKVGKSIRKGVGVLTGDEKWEKFWKQNEEQLKRWMNRYDIEIDKEKIKKEAEKDNYKGVLGFQPNRTTKKYDIIYKPEGTFNWESPGGGWGM